MSAATAFFAGLISGAAVAAFYFAFQRKAGQRQADEQAQLILKNLRSELGNLSLEALSRNTDEFLKLASSRFQSERELGGKELEGKKAMIDRQLEQMAEKLEKVSHELKNTSLQNSSLTQITGALRETLANSRARGQWGERMAEDILRLAGFAEGVNYLKQKAIEGVGSKPDYTFLMPKNSRLNMDVKFPYDNYVKFVNAKSEPEKEKYKADFFKDVKLKLKEVTGRDYINPQQNTLDYVILFVPNEQIFSFIHEENAEILDAGLKNKVIFCSPITLFAVLAIVRQAVDNFSLEQTSNEILSLLGSFKAQWAKFVQKLETVGKRIDDAQKEYQVLSTTRKTQLERPLNNIDALRVQKGLPIGEAQAQLTSSDEAEAQPIDELTAP